MNDPRLEIIAGRAGLSLSGWAKAGPAPAWAVRVLDGDRAVYATPWYASEEAAERDALDWLIVHHTNIDDPRERRSDRP